MCWCVGVVIGVEAALRKCQASCFRIDFTQFCSNFVLCRTWDSNPHEVTLTGLRDRRAEDCGVRLRLHHAPHLQPQPRHGSRGDFDGDVAFELLAPDQSYTELGAFLRTERGAEVAWELPMDGTLAVNLALATGSERHTTIDAGRTEEELRIWP